MFEQASSESIVLALLFRERERETNPHSLVLLSVVISPYKEQELRKGDGETSHGDSSYMQTCIVLETQNKTIVLFLCAGPNRLTEVFDYLHTSMGITRNQMLVWPSIFRTRPYIIRDRHLFLLALGRAQYDPCLENFVSLKVLGSSRDSEFCRNVAKCEEAEFHAFLKTLWCIWQLIFW